MDERFVDAMMTRTHVDVTSQLEMDWLETKSPGNAGADWKKLFCGCEFVELCDEDETGSGATKRTAQKHYGVVLTFIGDKATEFAMMIENTITNADSIDSVVNKGLESICDRRLMCHNKERISSRAAVVTLRNGRAELRVAVLNNTKRFATILENMETSAERVCEMILEQYRDLKFLQFPLTAPIAVPVTPVGVFYHRAIFYHRSARDDEYRNDDGRDDGDDDDGGCDGGGGSNLTLERPKTKEPNKKKSFHQLHFGKKKK